MGALVQAKTLGGDYDEAKLAEWMPRAVEEVVQQQLDAGVDIINDGEFGKTNWTGYIGGRLAGYEHRELEAGEASGSGTQAGIVGRDRRAFEEFYQDYDANTMRLRRERAGDARNWQINLVNVGPVSYTGQAAIASDVGYLKAAVGAKAGRRRVHALHRAGQRDPAEPVRVLPG